MTALQGISGTQDEMARNIRKELTAETQMKREEIKTKECATAGTGFKTKECRSAVLILLLPSLIKWNVSKGTSSILGGPAVFSHIL